VANLAAVDSVITRGLALLDSAIRAGEIKIDTERWAISAKYADRIDERQFALVLLGLAVKSARSLRAIQVLAREDLGSDASIIVRAMVETYATVIVLTGDGWPEKFDRYRVYMAKHESAHINDLRRNPHARPLTNAPGIEIAEQFLKDAAAFYGDKKLGEMAGDWFGGGVQAALRKRELESLYDSAYRVGSKATHALDPTEFVEWSDGEGYTVLLDSGLGVYRAMRLPSLAVARREIQ
jgi:hypothetical protein